MIHSKALIKGDFDSLWYKKWSLKLKQTPARRGKFPLKANKFWQNAIMAQALHERGVLGEGKLGLGFGVGKERLPALFASYGVKVTATDQDFSKEKAKEWDNDQLAHGAFSLNEDSICPTDLFDQNISYLSVDMTKIPKKLSHKYDFLWSNCALGHLGSIDKGLEFIEKSLECLKPGGWAVHTTEMAILSNDKTLDTGDTVFFRLKDIYYLSKRLNAAGYKVAGLRFNLGSKPADMEFTLDPPWGTHHSKLLYKGYMATQVLLIIQKPLKPPTGVIKKLRGIKHSARYHVNRLNMYVYRKGNRALSRALRLADIPGTVASDTQIEVVKKVIDITLGQNEEKSVRLHYKNLSGTALFKIYANFAGTIPLALSTDSPTNRSSDFASNEWHGNNRPYMKLYQRENSNEQWQPTEYIEPGKEFIVKIVLLSSNTKPGNYSESFCLAKEGDDVIPDTGVTIRIKVTR